MICPVDRSPLRSWERDGLELQACATCHGLWMSGLTVARLRGRTPLPKLVSGGSGATVRTVALRCPHCMSLELEHVVAAGIELDRCPGCRGVWFDAGEIETLLARARSAVSSRRVVSGEDVAAGVADVGFQLALEGLIDVLARTGTVVAEAGVPALEGLLHAAASVVDAAGP